jgi:hypothetical protein
MFGEAAPALLASMNGRARTAAVDLSTVPVTNGVLEVHERRGLRWPWRRRAPSALLGTETGEDTTRVPASGASVVGPWSAESLLAEVTAVIGGATAFVGPFSGLTHLAATLDVRSHSLATRAGDVEPWAVAAAGRLLADHPAGEDDVTAIVAAILGAGERHPDTPPA